jgi:hypothetical protein
MKARSLLAPHFDRRFPSEQVVKRFQIIVAALMAAAAMLAAFPRFKETAAAPWIDADFSRYDVEIDGR